METLNSIMAAMNAVLWHNSVLFILLGTGVVFTVWSGFSQYRALTHGTAILRGRYDDPNDPGSINHFQALSAALSATVGLGNIGGVAIAITLGGPGAVFWMWVVGFFGMALKFTEVTLAMLYRNTDDPDNPHGGPMWVVSKGLAQMNPKLAWLGTLIGGIFCITLLISATTGGNMFQAWNVGEVTHEYFGIPTIVSGIVLAILVSMVIIGGIKRIGAVAGRLVPIMVALYLLAGGYVLIANFEAIPATLALIVTSAFSPHEAVGAFLGGTVGFAFLMGMKRALFSNEAGQGSSPIAHAAAKTDEPVREGLVGGLEPFIDTLVVCTFTALVILTSGIWNRGAEAVLDPIPEPIEVAQNVWSLPSASVPEREINGGWTAGDEVFVIVRAHANTNTGNDLHRLYGRISEGDGGLEIEWRRLRSDTPPTLADGGLYVAYPGATLTARAFDSVTPGLGMWLITLATWLFAFSTIISWGYYGEQGMVFLAGTRSVLPYKVVYTGLILVATSGLITTSAELDNLTGIGVGVMLFANLPIMWIFGYQAMRAYREYLARLRSGDLDRGHRPPPVTDLISGRDVER